MRCQAAEKAGVGPKDFPYALGGSPSPLILIAKFFRRSTMIGNHPLCARPLKKLSCECYTVVTLEYERLLPPIQALTTFFECISSRLAFCAGITGRC
jgi:hypothetical protein